METLKILTDFYSGYDEDGRLKSRHGMVEFLTTMRYIEKYIQPGHRVLEIGAATGRYSHTLAQQGYRVDAVELVEHNIDIFRKHTQPGENVTVQQGNAMDLCMFDDSIFDITLLLGPMYHLFTKEDQKQALAEAIRVTKPGGIIYAAYCGNDASMVNYCFGRQMLKEPKYQALVDFDTFMASSDPAELFCLYRREQIDALMGPFSTERLHFVGTDMFTNYMRDKIGEMDDELYQMYLQYHFSICERADMVGLSHHFLDVFRKN